MLLFICIYVLDSFFSQLFWASASNMLMEDDATLLFEQPLIDFQAESNSDFGLKSQGIFLGQCGK
jgi:hypothetical protein